MFVRTSHHKSNCVPSTSRRSMNSFRISRCHLSLKTRPSSFAWKGLCSASRIRSLPKHNSPNDELVQVGIIGGPHGLKGEVRVQPTSDFEEERLGPPGPKTLQAPTGSLIQQQSSQLIQLESLGGRPHRYKGHDLWVLQFKGISTPEEAKVLNGYQMMIKACEREPLSEDEYYIQDLVGMEVIQQENQEILGTIDSVFLGDGATDILFVKLKDEKCKKPALIPFVEQFVPVVDLEHHRVEVTVPEEMIEMANLKSNKQTSSKKKN